MPSKQLPQPPTQASKQAAGADELSGGASQQNQNHATSIPVERVPASAEENGLTGPPPIQAFSSGRPVRTSRNPNPYYVDSIAFDVTPWSATKAQIHELNQSINQKTR